MDVGQTADASNPSPSGSADEVDLAVDLNVAGVSLEDEHVVLRNTGNEPIDFTGWQLKDRPDEGVVDTPIDDAFTFPDGFTLAPDREVTIWTADGEDTTTDLYWDLGTHLWRAEGDIVRILDNLDRVVFEFAYGDQT